MAAPCCPPGSHPAVAPPANYQPKGRIEKLGKVDAYVVGEKSATAIMVLPDLFGVDSGRTKAVCDDFAQNGHYVVLIDNFEGAPMKLPEEAMKGIRLICSLPHVLSFLFKHRWKHAKALFDEEIFPALESDGVTSIGTVSFCYGSYLALFLATYPQVKASVCFHPSILSIMQITREKHLPAFEDAKGPFLMCTSKDESKELKANSKVAAVLAKQSDKSKFSDFPAMKHGWMNRGNIDDEAICTAVEKGFNEGLAFFKDNL